MLERQVSGVKKLMCFLQVQEIAKQNVAHTFSITGKKRSLELQARYDTCSAFEGL